MDNSKHMIAILHYAIKAIDSVLEKDIKLVRTISEKKQQMNSNAKFSNRTAKDQQKMELIYSEISRLKIAKKIASQILANNQAGESFYQTIMSSPQWQDWVRLQEEEMDFDVYESIECGVISSNHFQAFLKFLKRK